jgi:hypothetical protein
MSNLCAGGAFETAQRLKAGDRPCKYRLVLKSLLTQSILSAVPSGLAMLLPHLPNVETLGYYRTSLRDENEFLVALDYGP